MIGLRIEQAVAVYVLFFIILFLGAGIFSLGRKREKKCTREFKLWRCPICTFVYSDGLGQKLTICPRCGSYNERGEDA